MSKKYAKIDREAIKTLEPLSAYFHGMKYERDCVIEFLQGLENCDDWKDWVIARIEAATHNRLKFKTAEDSK